jgi:hypothetical protein
MSEETKDSRVMTIEECHKCTLVAAPCARQEIVVPGFACFSHQKTFAKYYQQAAQKFQKIEVEMAVYSQENLRCTLSHADVKMTVVSRYGY